jgi:hypothetical protein
LQQELTPNDQLAHGLYPYLLLSAVLLVGDRVLRVIFLGNCRISRATKAVPSIHGPRCGWIGRDERPALA